MPSISVAHNNVNPLAIRKQLRHRIAGTALITAATQLPIIDSDGRAHVVVTAAGFLALNVLISVGVLIADSPIVYQASSWASIAVLGHIGVATMPFVGMGMAVLEFLALAAATTTMLLCRHALETYACPRCRTDPEGADAAPWITNMVAKRYPERDMLEESG